MCYQLKFLTNEVCAPTPPSCLHLHWVALTRTGKEINQMSASGWYLFFWGSGSFIPEVVNLRNQAGAKLFPGHNLLLKEGRLDREELQQLPSEVLSPEASCSNAPVMLRGPRTSYLWKNMRLAVLPYKYVCNLADSIHIPKSTTSSHLFGDLRFSCHCYFCYDHFPHVTGLKPVEEFKQFLCTEQSKTTKLKTTSFGFASILIAFLLFRNC